MTGQLQRNMDALRACAAEGLTVDQAAERTGLRASSVRVYCMRGKISLARSGKRGGPSRKIQIDHLRALAADGLTRREAAEKTGVGVICVRKVASAHNIPFKDGRRGRPKRPPNERDAFMAAMFKNGRTLQQIGNHYGLTRERVRQIITKYHGLRAPDGGYRKVVAGRVKERTSKKEAACLKKFGCTRSEYLGLLRVNKTAGRPGHDGGAPTHAFVQQRSNARRRGIGWELTLWQWWRIWRLSGKWAERGRGQGYVMCRQGDEGPYAVGNVFIAPARVNTSERKDKKSGLPIGVKKNKRCAGFVAMRQINGEKLRLGTHPTPELAHAAYLAASDRPAPAEQDAA